MTGCPPPTAPSHRHLLVGCTYGCIRSSQSHRVRWPSPPAYGTRGKPSPEAADRRQQTGITITSLEAGQPRAKSLRPWKPPLYTCFAGHSHQLCGAPMPVGRAGAKAVSSPPQEQVSWHRDRGAMPGTRGDAGQGRAGCRGDDAHCRPQGPGSTRLGQRGQYCSLPGHGEERDMVRVHVARGGWRPRRAPGSPAWPRPDPRRSRGARKPASFQGSTRKRPGKGDVLETQPHSRKQSPEGAQSHDITSANLSCFLKAFA